MTTPPPTPVPRVSMTMFCVPRPAPVVHSASAAALASFSTATGSPRRSAAHASMLIARAAFQRGGYHSRPDGRRGEALPRLQGWSVEGEAPHATPARAPSEVGRILTGREEKEEASPQAPPLRPVVRDP